MSIVVVFDVVASDPTDESVVSLYVSIVGIDNIIHLIMGDIFRIVVFIQIHISWSSFPQLAIALPWVAYIQFLVQLPDFFHDLVYWLLYASVNLHFRIHVLDLDIRIQVPIYVCLSISICVYLGACSWIYISVEMSTSRLVYIHRLKALKPVDFYL